MYEKVIKNGIVYAFGGFSRLDIGINGGTITGIGCDLSGAEMIYADQMLVLPGLIDGHTHMGIHSGAISVEEDFYSGTVAAAAGGVTTIIDFTDGSPDSTLSEDIRNKLEKAKIAVIDYSFHAEVIGWFPGKEKEFAGAISEGVTSFKFYTTYSRDKKMISTGGLLISFRELSGLGGLAIVHAEDDNIINTCESMIDSYTMKNLPETRPEIAESLAIDILACLAEYCEAQIHIVHLSSMEGFKRLTASQSRKVSITAETCPQYLVLDEGVYNRPHGGLYAAAPLFRSSEDMNALWTGLKSGSISFIASDHCCFNRAQKLKSSSFKEIPFGLPGVETLLPVIYSEGFMKKRIDLPELPKLLSTNVARRYGLFPRKGIIAVGADADLVIFDPKERWKIQSSSLHMKTDFTPYEGFDAQGRVVSTFSRGELIFHEGKNRAPAGRGRFLRRRPSLKTLP